MHFTDKLLHPKEARKQVTEAIRKWKKDNKDNMDQKEQGMRDAGYDPVKF